MDGRGLKRMRRVVSRFMRDASGATAIEYAVVAVGIAVAVAATVFSVGTSLDVGFYQKVQEGMNTQ